MLHSIQYSIIQHLKNALPELNNVIWMYSGVKLKNERVPFVTVENLNTDVRQLDKLHENVANLYLFQIGVYNDKHGENVKLAEKVKVALIKDPIKLFDTDINKVVGTFRVEVMNIEPILPDDIEDELRYHRRYLNTMVYLIQKI